MGNKSSSGSSDSTPAEAGAAPEQAPQQMGYMEMLRTGYGELVNAIIRPPRAEYEIADLGPTEFTLGGKQFSRRDIEIIGSRNLKLQCSWWALTGSHEPAEPVPCVICMHGNSSCRLEALNMLTVLLATGVSVLAFDFAGSGMSEGEYVSLGFYERDDLAAVVNYLRESGKVSTLGLWGRSMGAATALMHGHRDPSIAAMVVDSSFAELETLAKELVDVARKEGYTIPGFVVSSALSLIKGSVKTKANFDIKDLAPIKHADSCFIPALFAHAEGDMFIKPHHSDEIHAKYAGDKNIIKVEGDHNTPRPGFFLDSAGIFLSQALQVPPELMLDPESVRPSRLPWHQAGAGYNHSFYRARDTVLPHSPGAGESPAGSRPAAFDFDAMEEEQLQKVMAASMAGGTDENGFQTVELPEAGGGNAPRIESEQPSESAEQAEPEKVAMLVEMGFDEATATEYLKKCSNDMEAAVQCILSQ